MNTNESKVRLLTIKQAAKVIDGLTEYRIRQLCRTEELPYIRAGKKYLINEQTLINFIESLDKEGR
ncbi:MAG: helix-turn-helix domain-containing protein [Oscillospiraceae bacterium]|nr:helix-turn-helix domain-containing protein [Oscillospiraceae bacterium]